MGSTVGVQCNSAEPAQSSVPDRVFEGSADRMSDGMSEDLSDRVLEDTSDRCQRGCFEMSWWGSLKGKWLSDVRQFAPAFVLFKASFCDMFGEMFVLRYYVLVHAKDRPGTWKGAI